MLVRRMPKSRNALRAASRTGSAVLTGAGAVRVLIRPPERMFENSLIDSGQGQELPVRRVAVDHAASLRDGVRDDEPLEAGKVEAAPDQVERRLATLAQVTAQPAHEGDRRVL